MTEIDREKVIEGLEFTKSMITFNPSTGEDIDPEALNEDNRITYDACIGAISLLKEQEAKPVELHTNAYGTRFYFCPKCKRELFHTRNLNFCERCGQAVKWDG